MTRHNDSPGPRTSRPLRNSLLPVTSRTIDDIKGLLVNSAREEATKVGRCKLNLVARAWLFQHLELKHDETVLCFARSLGSVG
jgi:hypothetical protein